MPAERDALHKYGGNETGGVLETIGPSPDPAAQNSRYHSDRPFSVCRLPPMCPLPDGARAEYAGPAFLLARLFFESERTPVLEETADSQGKPDTPAQKGSTTW